MNKQERLALGDRIKRRRAGQPIAETIPEPTPVDWDQRRRDIVRGFESLAERLIYARSPGLTQARWPEMAPGAMEGFSGLQEVFQPEIQALQTSAEIARPAQAVLASANPFSDFDPSRLGRIREQSDVGPLMGMQQSLEMAVDAGEVSGPELMLYEALTAPEEAIIPGGIIRGPGMAIGKTAFGALAKQFPDIARWLNRATAGTAAPTPDIPLLGPGPDPVSQTKLLDEGSPTPLLGTGEVSPIPLLEGEAPKLLPPPRIAYGPGTGIKDPLPINPLTDVKGVETEVLPRAQERSPIDVRASDVEGHIATQRVPPSILDVSKKVRDQSWVMIGRTVDIDPDTGRRVDIEAPIPNEGWTLGPEGEGQFATDPERGVWNIAEMGEGGIQMKTRLGAPESLQAGEELIRYGPWPRPRMFLHQTTETPYVAKRRTTEPYVAKTPEVPLDVTRKPKTRVPAPSSPLSPNDPDEPSKYVNIFSHLLTSGFVNNSALRLVEKLSAVPKVGYHLAEQFNPATVGNLSLFRKAAISYAGLGDSIETAVKMRVARLAGIATDAEGRILDVQGPVWQRGKSMEARKEQLGRGEGRFRPHQQQVWQTDEKGNVTNLKDPNVGTKSRNVSEIIEHANLDSPAGYTRFLTDAQIEWIKTWENIRDERLQSFVARGMGDRWEELIGQGHFPRITISRIPKGMKSPVTPSRIGIEKSQELPRIYRTIEEGQAAGDEYLFDPDAVVELFLRDAYQMEIDHDFIEWLTLSKAKGGLGLSDGGGVAGARAFNAVEQLKDERNLIANEIYGGKDFDQLNPDQQKSVFERNPAVKDPTGKGLVDAGETFLAHDVGVGKKFRGYIVPEEIANELDRLIRGMHDPTRELVDKTKPLAHWAGKGFQALNNVANTSRFFQTGMDPGFFFIQGKPLLFTRPDLWARTTKNALNAFLDPKVLMRFYEEKKAVVDVLSRNTSAPLMNAEYVQAVDNKWIQKFPTSARWATMFNTFMDVGRILYLEAYLPTVKNPQEIRELVNFTDHLLGVQSSRSLGVTGTRRAMEGAIISYAPRYRRSAAALIVDAMQGGVRGEHARRALLRINAAQAFILAAFGACLMQFSNDNADRIPVTFHPTKVADGEIPFTFTGNWSLFNPSHPNYGVLVVGGTEMGWAGADISMGRAAASIITGIRDGEFIEPILRTIRSQLAPTTGLAVDVFMDADYFGEPIRNLTGGAKRILEMHLPFYVAPYVGEGIIDSIDSAHTEGKLHVRGVIEEMKAGKMPGPERGIAAWGGLREFPSSPLNRASYDLTGTNYESQKEPNLRDIIKRHAQKNYALEKTEFDVADNEEREALIALSERPDLSRQKRANEFFKIRNQTRGGKDWIQRLLDIEFKEKEDLTPSEAALEATYALYEDYDEETFNREFARMSDQWGPDITKYVKRNLNLYTIPEKLYYQLPLSITERFEESYELREDNFKELGWSEGKIKEHLVETFKPTPEGEVTQEILDLRKLHDSGLEQLVGKRKLEEVMKQASPISPELHPDIEVWIDADREQKVRLKSDLENRAKWNQIEQIYSISLTAQEREQVDLIVDDAKAGGELEYLAFLHGKHPDPGQRMRNEKWLTGYNKWLKERSQAA